MAVADKSLLRRRAVALATAGLILALSVGLVLRVFGLLTFSYRIWFFTFIATCLVQIVVWLIPYFGFDRYLPWDPYYIYVPMMAVVFQFNLWIYNGIELPHLVLMLWFITLLFAARIAGFWEVILLSAAMAVGYFSVMLLLRSHGASVDLSIETRAVIEFSAMCFFTGIVFDRLKKQRLEMKELRKKLSELALTDELTGLANRRQFEQILQNEMARSQRYGGALSLAMIDVDYFKSYNDVCGHLAGDAVLREIAEIIRMNLRIGDFAGRYGGEEFVLIMPNTSKNQGIVVLEDFGEL